MVGSAVDVSEWTCKRVQCQSFYISSVRGCRVSRVVATSVCWRRFSIPFSIRFSGISPADKSVTNGPDYLDAPEKILKLPQNLKIMFADPLQDGDTGYEPGKLSAQIDDYGESHNAAPQGQT